MESFSILLWLYNYNGCFSPKNIQSKFKQSKNKNIHFLTKFAFECDNYIFIILMMNISNLIHSKPGLFLKIQRSKNI